MELLAEPTPFSERKAVSDAPQWLGADDPPGSKSGACKEEFYRNLGDLMISPMKINAVGVRLRSGPGRTVVASMTMRSEQETPSGYGAATATERRWRDQEKSELASGTCEAGEPDRRDPVEGRRRRI